jgi:L-arabinonolactonase
VEGIGVIEPSTIIRCNASLGESIIWDEREQAALWVDIDGARFWRWQPELGAAQSFDLRERPGSFALTPLIGSYIGAFESGFAHFTPATAAFSLLAPVTKADCHLRMNDGRVDRRGRFWAGSMAEKMPPGAPLGCLWRYDGGTSATPFFDGIQIPNSLCWNRAGTMMYFADSPRQLIWRYDFDPDAGPVGAPHIFAKTPEGIHPDGSCVDADDHLWNAQWGGSRVVRYRPDGSVERIITLPVGQPSCVALGGASLDQLMITTARIDLSADALAMQPLAGSMLVYDVGVRGLPEEICLS